MTKQEYIARQRLHRERGSRRAIWFLVVLFGGIGAMIPCASYTDRHPESGWIGNLVGAGLIVLLLGSMVWMALTMRRIQREFGVQCRACGKQVVIAQIAIATGNCGYCGEKLFD